MRTLLASLAMLVTLAASSPALADAALDPIAACTAGASAAPCLSGCHGGGGAPTLAFVVLALALLAVAHHLPRRRPYRVAIPVLVIALVVGAVGSAVAAPEQLRGAPRGGGTHEAR